MDIIDHKGLGEHIDKENEKKTSKTQTWMIAILLLFNIVCGSLFVEANSIALNFLLMLISAVVLIGVSFVAALIIAAFGFSKMSFKKRLDHLVPRIYIVLTVGWAVFTILIIFTALINSHT